ncbi:MAG: glycosyl transferase, partial [Epsilonproteobacteria bacterium]|nr:glycosyl transferase [Campylobacterota bacterium]
MFYVLLFVLSALLTYAMREYAKRAALISHANERSSHSVPTPHGGGVAIALVWFGALSYLFFAGEIEPKLFYALMFGAFLAAV